MFDKFHSLIKFEKIQNYSVMCWQLSLVILYLI
jgi:hypothetical protein